jgi:hypothetical protein
MPYIYKSEVYVQFTFNPRCYLGWWSTSRPGRFTLAKDPVPIAEADGWAQRWYGRLQKISFPPGFERRALLPEAPVLFRPIKKNL